MHGILPVHIGMRLRLLAKFNADLGLVQETCCTVVESEPHAQDRVRYDATAAGDIFHPDFPPAGLWVSVDNYDKCPLCKNFMHRFDDGSNPYDNAGPGPSISIISARNLREAGEEHVVPAGHGNHGQFVEYSDDTLAGVYLNLNLLVQIDGLRFAESSLQGTRHAW